MPNHVENIITLKGDEKEIREMLEVIKNDDFGLGTLDFNKIIPMPESLNIESGSRTDRGLKAYRGFIEVYIFGRSATDALKALEDIPVESEEIFLHQRTDIPRDEWELGKTAWNNIKNYGAPTWYEWSINNWGTKWNAFNQNFEEPNVLWFDTAWEGVPLLIQTLSEIFPDVEFQYAYADEDLGSNVGKGTIRNGETDMTFPDNGSNEAFEIVFFVKPGLEEYLELTDEGYRWKA